MLLVFKTLLIHLCNETYLKIIEMCFFDFFNVIFIFSCIYQIFSYLTDFKLYNTLNMSKKYETCCVFII